MHIRNLFNFLLLLAGRQIKMGNCVSQAPPQKGYKKITKEPSKEDCKNTKEDCRKIHVIQMEIWTPNTVISVGSIMYDGNVLPFDIYFKLYNDDGTHNRTVGAHMFVILLFSNVLFKSIIGSCFGGITVENGVKTLDLPSRDAEAFKLCIDFMYGKKIDVGKFSDTSFARVYRQADFLSIKSLVETLDDIVKDELDINLAVSIVISDPVNDPMYRRAFRYVCMSNFIRNFESSDQKDEQFFRNLPRLSDWKFLDLPYDVIQEIAGSEAVVIPECDLVESLLCWYSHNKNKDDVSETFFEKVFKKCRLENLKKDHNLLMQCKIFSSDGSIPVEVVDAFNQGHNKPLRFRTCNYEFDANGKYEIGSKVFIGGLKMFNIKYQKEGLGPNMCPKKSPEICKNPVPDTPSDEYARLRDNMSFKVGIVAGYSMCNNCQQTLLSIKVPKSKTPDRVWFCSKAYVRPLLENKIFIKS